jgi:hypothetical protein
MSATAETLAAGRAGGLRYPDFFIVGHAKCGTTALYEMLRTHPQIFMPDVKEPQFFARNPRQFSGGERELPPLERTGRREETLQQYLSLFAPARPDQRVGEASTFYLWSRIAPGRIAQARPDARIVAILREPASFLRSLHLQMVQNEVETEKDLRKALALEEARRQGRRLPGKAHWPEALMYAQRVRYVEQLRRYHETFGHEQVLVLIYDDFRDDNEATVRRVLRFLGVDERLPLQRSEANPTVSVRSVRLAAAVRELRVGEGPLARAARGALRATTSRAVRGRLLYPLRRALLYGAPAPPDERLMAELRSRFKAEVVGLSEYLGRDLVSLWGYGDVR